jgi:AcrR family transcriptional regulator
MHRPDGMKEPRVRNESATARSAWDKARSEVMKIKLEAILQEADVLFSRKGYNSTSLDDISARLDITKTALYHYVKNKNELLFLCYQRSVELTEQCYNQADEAGTTGLEKVRAYLRIDASNGVMAMTPLNELDAIRDPKRRQQLGQRISACETRFRGFIEQGIRDGSIQNCDPYLTSLFILGASRYMMQWYNPDARQDIKAIVEQFISFCCHGIEPPSTAEKRLASPSATASASPES